MYITYFHWAKHNSPGIGRGFRPLIDNIGKIATVQEYYVPYSGSLPWNMLRNILFVRRHRNKKGINHITGDIHYCILGLLGCKSVLTIHDDYAIVMARRGWWDKVCKWIFWIYLPVKFADRVLCISEATKNKIDRLVRNSKTEVLSNHTVDTEFKYVPKNFNRECPVVLQVGTNKQKNIETTLKAIAGMKCKLRVVKKMLPEQQALAQSLNIDYTNVFDISDQQIVEEYLNADIVAFPSLFEGFGLPILEGQAIGRVVITTNDEPMRSVAGGGAVLLNDPTDVEEYRNALKLVIEDDEFRDNVIKQGLENAKQYSIEIVVNKFCQYYENIYAKHNNTFIASYRKLVC
jgi:glycosyltransferase involved in cell wall biosynthesis